MVPNSYVDNNGVYLNKLGITDAALLKSAEYAAVGARADEILSKHVVFDVQGYGLERQQAIHQYLFQDVYEWAGKTRTVPLSKRIEGGIVTDFADPDTFAEDWQKIKRETDTFLNAQGLSFDEKRDSLVDIFIAANHVHPFPEGNGRSLQVFMKQLAQEQGVELDYSKIDAQEWNRASALSSTNYRLFEHQFRIPNAAEPELIRNVFAKMAKEFQA
jgi:cell filamentation protein